MTGNRSMTLEELLDYEVRGAKRYCRFLSLVMMTSVNGSGRNIDIPPETLRESDECFSLGDDAVAVLMGETPKEGALKAISRYKGKLANGVRDVRFSTAAFPADARASAALLRVARERLEYAKQGEPWAVATGE